ncbi:MAG: tRNA (adenosine(37)-N6)-dimethylallyltransferase MiaA [Candidatus Hydrogenedentes bacterium]|nr:tRNA (adenosine(37)-N6)-dimethylallyltransferase MiaA [Candidatus Hydrogenedentota bacterium]
MTPPAGAARLLAVVGPTASGKTSLAIELAERLGAEIISADSMQVYRGMAIGTAAPTPDEQARVKHHLVGILTPDQPFSAGEFQRRARAVVAEQAARGRPVIVAGGSGLYLRALIDGLFPGPKADAAVRGRLHDEADRLGVPALYERLARMDPDYADLIQENDLRRIVRALEVHALTGRPFSELHREHRSTSTAIDTLQVALDYPRARLYARIDARVDRILANGFIDEVQALLDAGYEPYIQRLRSLGYREFIGHLRGELSLAEATDTMKRNHRRFAKRQLSWFRADPRIHWLPADDDTPPGSFVEPILDLFARHGP